MNILIYSILRDNEKKMGKFFSQIISFVSALKHKHNFYISLYENDSSDYTPDILKNFKYKDYFVDYSVITEKKGLPKFGSVAAEERVKNLSIARNIALTAKDMYKEADYVLALDSDIEYNNEYVEELFNWDQFNIEPDMFSGVVIRKLTKEEADLIKMSDQDGYVPYDTWSMRRNKDEEWGSWKQDFRENPVSKFYCTFNGLCMIRAKAFQEGARYGYFNERLNKFDLEHAVLAEWFHAHGYDKIYVNQNLWCYTSIL